MVCELLNADFRLLASGFEDAGEEIWKGSPKWEGVLLAYLNLTGDR